ncbi:MAG TPA: serine protease [Gemmataceae bacterium]|jgi:hypothetical protein|nr:serine protease [Gemmataceae bacterium]
MNDATLSSLLADATALVKVNGQPAGTAWLFTKRGHFLTAAHVIKPGEQNKITVDFPTSADSTPHPVTCLAWNYDPSQRIDFCVLKLVNEPASALGADKAIAGATKAAHADDPMTGKKPVPLSFPDTLTLHLEVIVAGYPSYGKENGKPIQLPATAKYIGLVPGSGMPRWKFESTSLGADGYSGSAIVDKDRKAAVAITTKASPGGVGKPGAQDVLACPLSSVFPLLFPFLVEHNGASVVRDRRTNRQLHRLFLMLVSRFRHYQLLASTMKTTTWLGPKAENLLSVAIYQFVKFIWLLLLVPTAIVGCVTLSENSKLRDDRAAFEQQRTDYGQQRVLDEKTHSQAIDSLKSQHQIDVTKLENRLYLAPGDFLTGKSTSLDQERILTAKDSNRRLLLGKTLEFCREKLAELKTHGREGYVVVFQSQPLRIGKNSLRLKTDVFDKIKLVPSDCTVFLQLTDKELKKPRGVHDDRVLRFDNNGRPYIEIDDSINANEVVIFTLLLVTDNPRGFSEWQIAPKSVNWEVQQ